MRFLVDFQGWLYGGAAAELKSIAAGMGPLNLVAAMAIAAMFGLVHALMPGHGKTVVVSYYLGRPASVLSSLGTSVILVLTHVGSAIVLVLAGIILVRRTLGGAGRAPELETVSAAAIIAIGLWLLYRALRPHDHARAGADGRLLAFATGLVPCPLTTFIMVYASAQGIVLAGLLVTAGMAFGMMLTIASFALAAVLLRDRLMALLERTARLRGRLGHILELGSALAIVAFGVWLLAMR
jgi:nickel/cobalt exporter